MKNIALRSMNSLNDFDRHHHSDLICVLAAQQVWQLRQVSNEFGSFMNNVTNADPSKSALPAIQAGKEQRDGKKKHDRTIVHLQRDH